MTRGLPSAREIVSPSPAGAAFPPRASKRPRTRPSTRGRDTHRMDQGRKIVKEFFPISRCKRFVWICRIGNQYLQTRRVLRCWLGCDCAGAKALGNEMIRLDSSKATHKILRDACTTKNNGRRPERSQIWECDLLWLAERRHLSHCQYAVPYSNFFPDYAKRGGQRKHGSSS